MPAKKSAKGAKKVARRKASAARAKPTKSGSRQAGVGKAFRSRVGSVTPFLWFANNDFEQAARFYVSLLPGSRLDELHAMGGTMTLAGQRIMGLNGGPHYRLTPAFSLFVVCKDQKEVDRIWTALKAGGQPSRCGWIDDRFGVTWQVIPEAFLRFTADPDPKKVKAVLDAMMDMVKMDVAGLQAAYDKA